ncbi:MAG: MipA/OmpV family protein [Halobacteriovoraceae bacterium]|nr:MipA/OmpV family protein [Halobacteriovoraceae bacterium]
MKLLILTTIFFIPLKLYPQSYRLLDKELPVLEIGAGVGWAHLPYYPGGSEMRDFIIPFPSFVYRGKKIRADEDGGLRGRFFSSERFEINTSFGFNLPGSSEDIAARRGMEDLDPIIEVGPGIIYHIIPRSKAKSFSLSLNIGLRAAVSSDFQHTQQRGAVFSPLLFSWYQITDHLTLFNGLSGTWASQQFHAFFYDVEEKYSTSNRAQYKSESGLFSSSFSNFFIYNLKSQWSFVLGFVFENFKDAANRNSPLLERENTFSTIVGFNYWFYQSEEKTKGIGAI